MVNAASPDLTIAAEAPEPRGSVKFRMRIGTLIMIGAVAINGWLTSVLAPVLSTAAKHFGSGSGGQIAAQTITTMSSIGVMVGGPLAGILAERIGLRRTLFLSLAVFGIVGSAGLYLDSLTLLFVARFIHGLAAAGVTISTAAMIGSRFTGLERQKLLGYQGAFIAVAGFVMVRVAGRVAEAGGWRAPFAIYLLALVLLALAVYSITPEPKIRREDTVTARVDMTLLAMWPTYLMIVLIYMVGWMIYLQLSFVLADDGIGSMAVQANIVSISSAMHLVGGLAYGWVTGRIGQKWMLFSVLTMMAASDILVGVSHGVVPMMIAVGLAGLGGGNMLIFLTNFLLERAPEIGRARAIGFMFAAMYIGEFLNPFVITPMRALIGNHQTFALVGVGLLVAALAQGFGRGRPPATA